MFMRHSRFRHVFGDTWKKELCYENLRLTKNAHDGTFVAVNPKFLAVASELANGAAFYVLPLEKRGRVDVNAPKVFGHNGPIQDLKWSPFCDHLIASASDDCCIKLWQIPPEGLTENLQSSVQTLAGHQRKILYLEWHPTVKEALASVAMDFQLCLWDVQRYRPSRKIDCHDTNVFCASWDRNGSRLATSCKDKQLRIIDPRHQSAAVVLQTAGHDGTKASKCCFVQDNHLYSVGFSRFNDRMYGLWDLRNFAKPFHTNQIDSSAGIIQPYYDWENRVMFLAGKGDGNIRYYEIVDEEPFIHFLSAYLSPSPQRTLGVMPKRGLDYGRCELIRFYKIHTNNNLCEPISMTVPRRSDEFQADIYPECPAPIPSQSVTDWMAGDDCPPELLPFQELVSYELPNELGLTYQQLTVRPEPSKSASTNKSQSRAQPSSQQQPASVSAQPPSLHAQPPSQPTQSLRNIEHLTSSTDQQPIHPPTSGPTLTGTTESNGVGDQWSQGPPGLKTSTDDHNLKPSMLHRRAAGTSDAQPWAENDERRSYEFGELSDRYHQTQNGHHLSETSGPHTNDNASFQGPFAPAPRRTSPARSPPRLAQRSSTVMVLGSPQPPQELSSRTDSILPSGAIFDGQSSPRTTGAVAESGAVRSERSHSVGHRPEEVIEQGGTVVIKRSHLLNQNNWGSTPTAIDSHGTGASSRPLSQNDLDWRPPSTGPTAGPATTGRRSSPERQRRTDGMGSYSPSKVPQSWPASRSQHLYDGSTGETAPTSSSSLGKSMGVRRSPEHRKSPERLSPDRRSPDRRPAISNMFAEPSPPAAASSPGDGSTSGRGARSPHGARPLSAGSSRLPSTGADMVPASDYYELRDSFARQQKELLSVKEQLQQKDRRIKSLEKELHNFIVMGRVPASSSNDGRGAPPPAARQPLTAYVPAQADKGRPHSQSLSERLQPPASSSYVGRSFSSGFGGDPTTMFMPPAELEPSSGRGPPGTVSISSSPPRQFFTQHQFQLMPHSTDSSA